MKEAVNVVAVSLFCMKKLPHMIYMRQLLLQSYFFRKR